MTQLFFDDLQHLQIQLGLILVRRQIEESPQLSEVRIRSFEPRLVFDRAELAPLHVAEEIEIVRKPAIFSQIQAEPVADTDGARDLRGIAQAIDDFWREF